VIIHTTSTSSTVYGEKATPERCRNPAFHWPS